MYRVLAFLLLTCAANAQINVVGPPIAAYVMGADGIWTPQETTETFGAIQNAPPFETFCLNKTLNMWVPCPLNSGSTVFPPAGIAVSTGTSWANSLTPPVGAIVGTTDTQTLSNKTFSGNTQGDVFIANNFIGQLNGVSIGGTPAVGSVPVATSATNAVWGNNSPTGTGFWFSVNGVRDAATHVIMPQDLPATITSNTTGNASTSSAFDHTPIGCQPVAGITQYQTGTDAQGNSTGCSSPTGSGEPGSVTTITVDDIPDLATTTVMNASTTPHVSFTLLTAPAHSFFGNNTDTEGGAVGYSDLEIADLPEAIAGTQAHNTVWASPDAVNGIPSFRQLNMSDTPLAAPLLNPSFSGSVFTQSSTGARNFSTPDGGYCFGAVSVTSTPVICLWSDNATNVHFGTGTKAAASTINVTALSFTGTLNGNVNGTSTGIAGLQAVNTIYAGPSTGSPAAGAFRTMVSADLPTNPTLTGNVTVTGNINAPNGDVSSLGGFVSLNGGAFVGGLATTPTALTFSNGNCLFSVGGNASAFTVNASTVTSAQVCPITINAVPNPGQVVTITKIDANALVTLAVEDIHGTVNGQSSYLLTQQYQSVTLHSDGANWQVIAQNNPNITSSQPANFVFAAPNGVSGFMAPRTLVAADTPQSASLAGNNNFTGTNTVTTQVSTDSTTKVASTQFVHGLVNNITAGVATIPAGGAGQSVQLTITGISPTSVCTIAAEGTSPAVNTSQLQIAKATNTLFINLNNTVATTVALPVDYICTFKPQ